MFANITVTVNATLAAITTLAGAANKLAGAVDNIATVAEEKSALFADEARHTRAMERKALAAKMAAADAANAAATVAP